MFKRLDGDKTPLMMLLLMAIIGVATSSVGKLAFAVGLFVFAYGFITTIRKRNANGEAHVYAAMLIGAEVYFRMSFSGLPWEFVKIAVSILLLTGMTVERVSRPKPLIMVPYALLLVPALFVPEWQSMEHFKHDAMMNISGEVSLIIAVLYFYKRKMSVEDFARIGRMLVYGVLLMAVLVLVKSPDYGSIRYGGGSNFAASGGFGPNQVAGIFGLGIFVMGIFLLQNIRLFVYKWLDIALLVMFSLQGLFTLSRGGLIAAWMALAVGVIALYILNPKQAITVLKVSPVKLGLIGIALVLAFIQADVVSGGAVSKRYFNVDKWGNQIKEDYSTNRLGVVETDIQTFKDNWETGAGVGGGAVYREDELGFGATHVEFSRLLADHGVLGLFVLFVMFGFPISEFFQRKDARSRMVLAGFVALALVTMSHNAMRMGMPGFLYGLGFVLLYASEKATSIYRKNVA